MTLSISNTNAEGYQNGVSLLVYGESGSGKTHLLGTYPDGELLILSTERKLLTLKDRNIPVLTIDTFEDLQAAIAFCSDPNNVLPFKAIALDSATNIAKILHRDLGKNHSDKWTVFGLLGEMIHDELTKLIAIPKNIIVVAQQGSMDVGNGVKKNAPSFPGQVLPQAIPYMFDHIVAARTVSSDGATSFHLQTVPDYQYTAKGHAKLAPVEHADLPYIIGKILS